MANPARVPDPRHTDPLNPVPPTGADPFTPESRDPANDPRVVNRVESRSGGSSVLIAAIVLVLAVIAYFVFAPGTEMHRLRPRPRPRPSRRLRPRMRLRPPLRQRRPRMLLLRPHQMLPRLRLLPTRQRRHLMPLHLLRQSRLRPLPSRRSDCQQSPEMARLGGPFLSRIDAPSYIEHARQLGSQALTPGIDIGDTVLHLMPDAFRRGGR